MIRRPRFPEHYDTVSFHFMASRCSGRLFLNVQSRRRKTTNGEKKYDTTFRTVLFAN